MCDKLWLAKTNWESTTQTEKPASSQLADSQVCFGVTLLPPRLLQRKHGRRREIYYVITYTDNSGCGDASGRNCERREAMQPENDNKDDDKRSFEFDFGPNSIFNFILIFKTSNHHRHHLFHHYRLSATYHFSSTTTVTMIIPIRSTTPSPSSSQPFLRHRNVIPPLLHNYHHLKEHCLLNYCRRW